MKESEMQKIEQISAKVNRSEKRRSHKRLIEMEREIQTSVQGGEEQAEQEKTNPERTSLGEAVVRQR